LYSYAMVNVVQAVLTWLSSSPLLSSPQDFLSPARTHSVNKSVAIIGAGTSGLAALKAILDLPVETRQFWSVVVFEQRRDVGGIWLPDSVPPNPPALPSTPLYPRLHTNTPHPWMTCPGFPFPPMTPLYPSHEHVLAYHQDYSEKFGLGHYIRLNTTVLKASWLERGPKGVWNIQTQHHSEGNLRGSVESHQFDHLIVASGHNHYPAVPDLPGSQKWLDNTPPGSLKRSILHSIFFRGPNNYANRTVVILGGGASGIDAAVQIEPIARKVGVILAEQSFGE
jgi:cation diffusion facilitator CzcD-associated flavoprotein CzcO